jgi:hypothetical protein
MIAEQQQRERTNMSKHKTHKGVVCEVSAERDAEGDHIYVVIDGVKIAKRGRPGTPQAKTWVSLEPGWRVLDGPDQTLVVEHDGQRIH